MTELSPYALHEFSVGGDNDSWSNLFGFIPPGSRVLDVGCSTGNFGEALEKLSDCVVVGVDLSAVDIAEAANRITSAVVADVTETGAFERLGKFDVIVFADVLEHLADPRSVLTQASRALYDGGRVVFSIPNMAHLSVRTDLLGGIFGYTDVGILDKTHLHFYDREAVEILFASSGFLISDERSVAFRYPDSWVAQTLARLGLTADERFEKVLDTTDAHILQFVGVARLDPTSGEIAEIVRERTFPPNEIDQWVKGLEAERDRLEEQRVAADAELVATRSRVADVEEQLRIAQMRIARSQRYSPRGAVRFLRRHLSLRR